MATDLARWVTDELRRRGWSIRELARRSGLSHVAISQVLSGQRQPGWDFCAAIAEPLEASPMDTFVLAGKLKRERLVNDADVNADVLELQELAATLDDEGRRCLLRVARALASESKGASAPSA
jgi:transcriptional regulator with XRE-family HTH domain